MTVLAPGYGRYSIYESLEVGNYYVARLDQDVDEAFLEALIAERDPRERVWMALEIVGRRGLEEASLEVVYPRLRELLPLLRAMVDSGAFDAPDDRTYSPAGRARRLLAYLHADEDSEVLAEHIESERAASRPSRPVEGQTPDEVCQRFTDLHFAEESVTDRTWNFCTPEHVDETAGRAMARFTVRYRHWGYGMLLFMRRTSDGWALTFVQQASREHYDVD